MEKSSLPICKELFSQTITKTIATEFTLPEYCPRPQKIIKADGSVSKTVADLSDGALSISASIVIKVLYLNENGGFKSVFFNHTLDASIELSKLNSQDLENPTVITKINIPRVSPKQKGADKIEIKADAYINVSLYCHKEIPLFSKEQTRDIESKWEKESLWEHYFVSSDTEELTDSITLEASLPQAAEIIDYSLSPAITSWELLAGSIKYHGTALFKCSYRSINEEEGDGEYIYLKKEMPFELELFSDNIEKDSYQLSQISVTALDVVLNADPYGENRLIDITASLLCDAQIFNPYDAEFIKDGFCSMYRCEFKKQSFSFDMLSHLIDTKGSVSETVSLNGVNLAEITDVEIAPAGCFTEAHENTVFACLRGNAKVLGSDEKGLPLCTEHIFTAKLPIDTIQDPDIQNKYTVICTPSDENAVIKNGELIISYNLNVRGAVMYKKQITAINDVEIFYDKPKPLCRSEYIIYYPDKNETLWDIAKKYEIPRQRILDANGLKDSEEITSKTFLIPCIL